MSAGAYRLILGPRASCNTLILFLINFILPGCGERLPRYFSAPVILTATDEVGDIQDSRAKDCEYPPSYPPFFSGAYHSPPSSIICQTGK
ncbi:hypothetical protein EV426DRAFT_588216 [Tirmania nivea]|nr:hypothetical protein EV426DRAFT_588216 [Tirmania nivea]